MKIQTETLAYLFVVRILTKKYSVCRAYLLDGKIRKNRKWDERELTKNELRRMKK